MNTVHVVWASWEPDTIARGYWDQGVLEDAISGAMWAVPHSYEFEHHVLAVPAAEGKLTITDASGAVVVIPGRHNAKHIDKLNLMLSGLDWCLLIVTGDEEGVFRLSDVTHPNLRAWVMTGRPQIDEGARRFLGSGYPPHYRELLPIVPAKSVPIAFAGQVTHQRRHDCVTAMERIPEAQIIETEGFTEGLTHGEYARFMARAKLAACPSGPASPDSFRFYEALEAGCLPVADAQTPQRDADGYWTSLFPAPAGEERFAFPIIDEWSQLPGLAEQLLADWPANVNRATTWWADQKREMAYQLHRDILDLSADPPDGQSLPDEWITVIMPTSPVPAHPDTSALVKTVESIRERLPHAEIIIAADGVRPEQEDRRADYDEYLRRVSWWSMHRQHNVLLTLSPQWRHQAGVTLAALEKVRTPYVLFVEHDTPLVGDIDWTACLEQLRGPADLVRFHHESHVLDVHAHLMLDQDGAPFRRTVQWSQRPHLTTVAFYRRILEAHFTPESRTMIEDTMHGIVHNAWREYGPAGWDRYRLFLYAPDTPSIQRSTHLDTRGAAPKFEMIP